MRNKYGIEIENIKPGSIAEAGGLLPGDVMVSINGYRLNDIIDYMFYKGETEINAVILRNGKKMNIKLIPEKPGDIGIVFKPFAIKRCNNHCIFCFVSQLPRGLRKSLYIKDEDYRMSFLYGNYVTLTNMSVHDKKRIIQQRLSPLYISVHSTNKTVRNTLLGNQKAGDICKELKFFKDNKIRMHTQIVLCPGYNDGKELQSTIRDLYRLYPYVSSVAVVPVGLTMHRKFSLKPVERDDALRALEIIDSFQKRFKKTHGDPLVYAADEMYIKAGVNFPHLKEYGDLPQIENGVGMVPLFMSQAKRVKVPDNIPRRKKFLTFTGVSFYPFIRKAAERFLERENINLDIVPVENTFFGKSITVTGLLTGRDVIRALVDKTEGYECLLIPNTVLKEGEDVFLDDISKKDIEHALNIKVRVIEPSPEGIMKGMEV